jgi:hypothetical protein
MSIVKPLCFLVVFCSFSEQFTQVQLHSCILHFNPNFNLFIILSLSLPTFTLKQLCKSYFCKHPFTESFISFPDFKLYKTLFSVVLFLILQFNHPDQNCGSYCSGFQPQPYLHTVHHTGYRISAGKILSYYIHINI